MAQDISSQKNDDLKKSASASPFSIEKETKEIDNFINIAFAKVDSKGIQTREDGKKIQWTVHNTNDDRISIIYRQSDDKTTYMVRSQALIDCTLNEVYQFYNCKYSPKGIFGNKADKSCTELRIDKVYDTNHCVEYASFSSGFPTWIISPRDFCYMKTRFKRKQYTSPNSDDLNDKNELNKYDIAGNYCYSINEDHIDYAAVKNGHVRGEIIFSGYVYYQSLKDPKKCVASKIVNMNPKGSIPSKVISYNAPNQGYNIKVYLEDFDTVREWIKKRNDPNEETFDANNNKNNNNDNDKAKDNNNDVKNNNDNKNNNDDEKVNDNDNDKDNNNADSNVNNNGDKADNKPDEANNNVDNEQGQSQEQDVSNAAAANDNANNGA